MKKTALYLLFTFMLLPLLHADAFWFKKKKKRKARTTQVIIPVIRKAAMARTACFGTCPVYVIEVSESGLIRYTGRANVTYKGIYEKNIPAAEVVKLLQELSSYRPDTCSNMYKLRVADLPNIFYTITYKDSVKKIGNADAGPGFFRDIAQEFDEIGKPDASWKKTGDEPENK